MRRLLPAFVQRRLLLSAARRALAAGRPEAALEILRDELLTLDPRAAQVRAMALPRIVAPPPPPKATPSLPAASPGSRDDLRDLLAQMREKKAAEAQPVPAAPRAAESGLVGAPANGPGARRRPPRLRLSLDDAGTFLVCAGEQAIVGHSRAGEADIPVLADLLPRHARFTLQPASFHASACWNVEALGSARVRLGERSLEGVASSLKAGDRLRLGEHLRLRFDQPDRSSDSCSLELESGVEASGARRILLFAPGAQGRMRLGSSSARHVQAPSLGAVELELEHDGVRLRIRCGSGMVPDEAQGSAALTEFELPLALTRPLHLRLCMPSAADRPRWISFVPLEEA